MRLAETRDLPAIQAIEAASFSDPWSSRDFTETLASGVVFLVAVGGDDRVSGYLVARQMADEGEILNLGVAPASRRRGVGQSLVSAGLDRLRVLGARAVFLEVRESNVAARALYGRFAFTEVSKRPKYYRRPVEDAILLRAAIPAGGASQ
ncbi:MAG TPA: ribosomal protein S18-alanine N-acetyltransferase [Gemmatimonadales bacterium]|nr:ribosomal protein S18-alanine N-acetyltransferase [Gemmatimonadales bacterium]